MVCKFLSIILYWNLDDDLYINNDIYIYVNKYRHIFNVKYSVYYYYYKCLSLCMNYEITSNAEYKTEFFKYLKTIISFNDYDITNEVLLYGLFIYNWIVLRNIDVCFKEIREHFELCYKYMKFNESYYLLEKTCFIYVLLHFNIGKNMQSIQRN